MSNDIAVPQNPTLFVAPDVYAAIRDFVAMYALPIMPVANIVFSWESAPANTTEYAVISINADTQRGTSIEEITRNSDPSGLDTLSVFSLVTVEVQIDFYAKNDLARQRARRLALIAGSSIGEHFLKTRGLSFLYADKAQDTSFTNDEGISIHRWATALHLSMVEGVHAAFETFDKAHVSHLKSIGTTNKL